VPRRRPINAQQSNRESGFTPANAGYPRITPFPPRRHGCTLKEHCAASTGFIVNNPKPLPGKQAEHIRHERNAAGKQKLERAANQSCQKAPAILANGAIA
jgi:hypothetical protein